MSELGEVVFRGENTAHFRMLFEEANDTCEVAFDAVIKVEGTVTLAEIIEEESLIINELRLEEGVLKTAVALLERRGTG